MIEMVRMQEAFGSFEEGCEYILNKYKILFDWEEDKRVKVEIEVV